MSGGTHAFVAPALGADGVKYVLKVDVPDMSPEEYLNELRTLRLADGEGYVRLHAFDAERRASLLERLGSRLKTLDLPVERQMEIICDALVRSWKIPARDAGLTNGADGIGWFVSFIPETWESVGRPCPRKVIDRALGYLEQRRAQANPSGFVLVHGDAHNNNTLQCLNDPNTFKLIDPDGLFYEPAYDLGVLMREWPEEYAEKPVQKADERAEFLSRLTGVEKEPILQWGFIQTVSTALVLLQINQRDLAETMLKIADAWCGEA